MLVAVAAGTGLLVAADQLLRGPRHILRFEYTPGPLDDAQFEALAGDGYSVDRIEVSDGVTLRGLVRTPTRDDAPFILYFAGNGADLLAGSKRFLETVRQDRDVGVAVFAYRGFDGSTGVPTMRSLDSDAETVLDHLRRRYAVSPDRLVVIGFSLGTHFASLLSARLLERAEPPRSVALLAPFTIIDVVERTWYRRWATPDRYENEPIAQRIAELCPSPGAPLREPILVAHGDADEALPVEQGRAIAQALAGRAELVIVRGASHTGVLEAPEVIEHLRDRLAPPVVH